MKHTLCIALAVGLASLPASGEDPWAPPAGFYDGATGTGIGLKLQLTGVMSSGHFQRNYGLYRNMSVIIDADPDIAGNILLVYNRASVSGNWDSGSTWNREHVWPQSRQPGSVSNSSTGNLGDPHALRPANPSINSSRGNKPFGGADVFGPNRSLGTFYFPGDFDKGDIARSLFYSDTRYTSSGLSLVNGNPSGNQMGDLGALLAWHYLDIPDEFERRRNHMIFSSDLNPVYYTNNRNAYIDRPEFVWSIYADQMNDTTLYFGDLEPADGESTIDIDLGNLLVGEPVDPIGFMLNKAGQDGTYYTLSATEGLTTSHDGPYQAFAMGGPDSEVISVTFDASLTGDAGFYFGSVTADNLDITTQGGSGNGANDGDDMLLVSASVFNPGNGSFISPADLNSMLIEFGTVQSGDGDLSEPFTLHNIADGGAFAAPIDIEQINAGGDTAVLTTDFTAVDALAANEQAGFTATLDDDSIGDYTATYTLRVYNERGMFPGNIIAEDLVLTLTGQVVADICDADYNGDGSVNFFDLSGFLSDFNSMNPDADINEDGSFNFFDLSAFLGAFTQGCP